MFISSSFVKLIISSRKKVINFYFNLDHNLIYQEFKINNKINKKLHKLKLVALFPFLHRIKLKTYNLN